MIGHAARWRRGRPVGPGGHRRRRDERASVAIEAAVGVPAFGLFVGLIVMGGRIELAHQAVESAAFSAARAASIERTTTAASAAGDAARSSLAEQDLHCARTEVAVNTAGFHAPLGTTAQVRVTVTCDVKLGDLGLPGVPGSRSISAVATSPIDAYRERP